MWLMTDFGFFSIVKKPGEKWLTVRARSGQDLKTLRERYLTGLEAIEEADYGDYRFRVRVPQEAFAEALKEIALDIDYPNFKDTVAKKQGRARARVYEEVWFQLMEIQRMGNCDTMNGKEFSR